MESQLPPCPALPHYDSAWRQRLRRRVLAWFDRHARDLPWRRTRDPYAIWVSEIMLQQTQVVTVIDYFQRFMAEFPRVRDLAVAPETRVLRLWEGLGYYRRARQLHQAAQVIVRDHGGQFPREFAEILALPGIGRYTAGAIASIAYDQRAPILEANTIRLFCRLLRYDDDPTRSDSQRLLWEFAEMILPRKRVGLFNQALMELGSEICTPRSPDCEGCPLRPLCPTAEAGLQQAIPAPKQRTIYEKVTEAAVVVRREGLVLLRRCAPDERWAGLWDFPRFSVDGVTEWQLKQRLAALTRERTGTEVEIGDRLAEIKHGVTRYRITLQCFHADWKEGDAAGEDLAWVPLHELDAYPLSVTGRRIAELLHRT